MKLKFSDLLFSLLVIVILLLVVSSCTPARADILSTLYQALQSATPVERQKIEYTLQQLNNQPLPTEDRYVLVNIPAYTVYAVEGGMVQFSSRAIVGARNTRTPVMVSNMWGIKYNPDWHAPAGITKRYTQKIVDGKWDYFQQHGIRVTQTSTGAYRFSQPSGPNNALGVIKFEMINEVDIYLHDTNQPDKYERTNRALSSGCVRVQEWKKLAAWVLNSDESFVDKQLANKRTRIEAITPIPVYIGYFPAWVVNGQVVYYEDVYKKVR